MRASRSGVSGRQRHHRRSPVAGRLFLPTLRTRIQALFLAPLPRANAATPSDLQVATQEFIAWLRDWRTTASAGISRRDYRLAMGIGSRKYPKTGEPVLDGPADDDVE